MQELTDALTVMVIETLHLEHLSPADIPPDAQLFGDDGIGLDSVDALELVVELERSFGVKLPDDGGSREVLRSIGTLATWVQGQRAT